MPRDNLSRPLQASGPFCLIKASLDLTRDSACILRQTKVIGAAPFDRTWVHRIAENKYFLCLGVLSARGPSSRRRHWQRVSASCSPSENGPRLAPSNSFLT